MLEALLIAIVDVKEPNLVNNSWWVWRRSCRENDTPLPRNAKVESAGK